MDLSIIIPTFGRPAKIGACLRRLAAQDLDASRYEVLVGLDGPDPIAAGASEAAWRESGTRAHLEVVSCPREGLAAVRNRLIERASGRVLLSLNDDVLAEPQLCRQHVAAHAERAKAGASAATIVGDSPWVVPDGADGRPDSMIDRLIRETSMIFFYDQMPGARDRPDPSGLHDPERDWGFRHAFGLNVSYPTEAVKRVGCYAVYPEKYGFEDNEIAWRLATRLNMPVLFRPSAVAWHDHRYGAADYLDREYKLGHAAWGFAGASPECSRAIFGRDIRDAAELAYSSEFIEREAKLAARTRRTFESLADISASAVSGPRSVQLTLVSSLYEQHLLLKRHQWRRGLIDAAAGRPMSPFSAVEQSAPTPPNLAACLLTPARRWPHDSLGTWRFSTRG
ncbi:MAG: glycosyltransferase family 2 protein [Phycisphaerales bacterium]|nr:glycosyltransferase family 2 protein [Phycisphaerales bacterium]